MPENPKAADVNPARELASAAPDLPPVGSYHFQLPRLRPDAFAEVDGGQYGPRMAVNFDERLPPRIVHSKSSGQIGKLLHTPIMNIRRETGWARSGQLVSMGIT